MNAVKMLIALAPTILLAAAAPAGELQPGQWEMVTEMTSIEAPGLPAPLLRQMRAQIAGHRDTRSRCITAEQARDPARNMMHSETPAVCEFGETSWAGGSFRIRTTCRPPDSPAVELALDGTYAARQIDGRIGVHMEMANPAGTGPSSPLDMQGRLTGRRTGECRSQ